jgi:NAD(P)H-flavin reductase
VFKIVDAAFIAPNIKRFVIESPRIARKQQPGQFVILRLTSMASAFLSLSNAPIPAAAPSTSWSNPPEKRPIC